MNKGVIKSVFDNEQELLKGIIEIHIPKGIELDPMCFKKNFYKEVLEPKYKLDINPLSNDIKKADARDLPFDNNIIYSIILDPPFMFDVGGKSNKYYSSKTHGFYKSFEDMINSYKELLEEAYRILIKNGILVFKCQDYRNISTHSIIRNIAIKIGFREKDICILNLPRNKIYNPNLKQRIFRNFHSYFWVFEKIQKKKEKGR